MSIIINFELVTLNDHFLIYYLHIMCLIVIYEALLSNLDDYQYMFD